MNTIKKRKRLPDYSTFKRQCKRYRDDHIWYNDDIKETITGITIEEMAKKLGYIGKNGKGQESKLSQYENALNGPPLKIVKKYADFFNLDKDKRLAFYYAALESSKKITINLDEIKGIKREAFIKFFLMSIIFNRPEDTVYSMAEKWVFELENLLNEKIII